MTGIEVTTMLAIGGALFSAVGSIAQGNAQASASNYNAQVNENNAIQAQMTAAEDERRTRRDNLLRLGSAAAQRGASGVTMEGSALETQTDSAAEGELRALDVRYEGLMAANNYRQQAKMDRLQASQAKRAGMFGAVGTLIGAGAQYGGSLLGGNSSLGGSTSYAFTQSRQSAAASTRYRTPY